MRSLKRGFDSLDRYFEYFVLACLVGMVLVVITQIFLREIFGYSLVWTEELSRILMVWIGFLGIAIGFREKAHIAISFFVDRLPSSLGKALGMFVYLIILAFGIYLVVQGWQFTLQTSGATLPASGLPRSVLYAVMPVTGVMVCIYTVLQILGIETVRHPTLTEEEHVE